MAAEDKPKKGGKAKKGGEKVKSVEPLKVLSEPAVQPSLPKKGPESVPLKKTTTKPVVPPKTAAPVTSVEVVKVTAPKKNAAKKKPEVEVTVEQIQLRAYFIAERRKSLGLEGTETGDWVQAEKELREESGK